MPAIFGYGLALSEERKALLNELVKVIVSKGSSAIVISGGYTSHKNNPELSEAAVIFAYLYKNLIDKGYRLVPKFWSDEGFSVRDLEKIKSHCGDYPQKREGEALPVIDCYIEDQAKTTRGNVQLIKELLEKHKVWNEYVPVAYCNKTHQVKIAALALAVWGYIPDFVVSPLSGLGDVKEWLKQSLIYTIPTVLALKVEFLRKLEDKRREEQMKNN